jgi:hypothetical protein
MSPERLPPTFSIQDVVQRAKEVLLKDGYHIPTVIAEGDKQAIITQIDKLAPTHNERTQQMFVLGFALARQADIGTLEQAFLITEAWMSVAREGTLPEVMPSQDPERREILIIAQAVLDPPKTGAIVFEMKRDTEGNLIGVDEANQVLGGKPEHSDSPLLTAFIIGFLGSSELRSD